MSEHIDVEQAKVMIDLINAQRALVQESAKQDVWGAKLSRTINHWVVYFAGTMVALGIAIGAISGIVWLFIQMKHLIGG